MRHCGFKPLLVVVRDGAESIILPLCREGRGLAGLANWYTFRLRAIATIGAGTMLFELLARNLAGHSSRIVLHGLPEEDSGTSRLETAFRGSGWLVFREICDLNRVLEVAGRSYAQYLASRPGALRTTLRRKSGKVDVRIETVFQPDTWPDTWDAYEAIYRQSWKPAEGSPEFLREFAEAEALAGRLRMGLALVDGEPVAAQFWTVEHDTAFIHKLAHLESAKSVSPGTILTAAMMQRVIDHDGVAMVDFGTGDDPYKRDWMEGVRLRYRLVMMRARDPENWPSILRLALRRMIRQMLPRQQLRA